MKDRAAALECCSGRPSRARPGGPPQQGGRRRFPITTSQAGSNFFIGNTRGDRPLSPAGIGHETYEFERLDAKNLAEQAAGHALTRGDLSYWWGASFAWITAHPGGLARAPRKKLLTTWNRAELPDSESLEIYADFSPVLHALARCSGSAS